MSSKGSARFADVRRLPEVDSTNTWLLREADGEASDGLVAVADVQTAGRGRLGRTWEAPPGSALLVSVLLRPRLVPSRLGLLTLAAGVAMAGALERTAGLDCMLKWPNDLRVAERKVGGILAEARTGSDGALDAVVVGVGVNLRRAALPADVAAVAISVEEAGGAVTRDDLLTAFLHDYEREVDGLEEGDVAEFLDRYVPLCETLGRRVRASLHTAPDHGIEGEAVRIAGDGALVLHTDDGTETAISFGEVEHLR